MAFGLDQHLEVASSYTLVFHRGTMVAHSKEQAWRKLSDEEIRLAKIWYVVDGKSPKAIADLPHRDKSTMARLLVKQLERKKGGRPPALSEVQKDALEKKLEELMRKAAGEWRVSAEMLKTS